MVAAIRCWPGYRRVCRSQTFRQSPCEAAQISRWVAILQADAGGRVQANSLVLGVIVSSSRSTGRRKWLTADGVGFFAVRVAQSGLQSQLVRLDDKATASRQVRELDL